MTDLQTTDKVWTRKVVVKERKLSPNNEAGDLNFEAGMMEQMAFTPSSHVVKLVRSPTTVQHVDASAGDSMGWDSTVRMLIMEYCPNGDLWALINHRRRLLANVIGAVRTPLTISV